MRAALSKAQLEADIGSRFGDAFKIHDKAIVETLATGVAEIDGLTGGLPRGGISEIFGPASSGRTSLMYSLLAYATAHEETCALVDTNDVFSPTAATEAGMDFDREALFILGGWYGTGMAKASLELSSKGDVVTAAITWRVRPPPVTPDTAIYRFAFRVDKTRIARVRVTVDGKEKAVLPTNP